jgi:3-deoxy-manno-octulosonate cytidylyltransferase (CMP-KDO synthetase)
MNIIAIIPARMGSSRFPGKPMEKINGIPMIEIVYKQVLKCYLITHTVVATCDNVIYNHIISIGGKAIMTSDKHERASDRCAEALSIMEKELEIKYDFVVMIQGDEPMIVPEMISESLNAIIDAKDILVVNLMAKIKSKVEFNDKNCIKVVTDKNNNALYFSREPIPSNTRGNEFYCYKQVCVIPFNRNFLIEYNNMEPTNLEILESIDMLRVLENGYRVHMVLTEYNTQSVDTIEDLRIVEKLLNFNKEC